MNNDNTVKVIVFGTGNLAKQIAFYLSQAKEFELTFFCVNKNYHTEKEFMGKRVLIFEEDLDSLSTSEFKFILAVGYKQMRLRRDLFEMVKNKGFDFINLVHSTANIMGVIHGEGNIIMANAIMEPFSRIYDNNIIWSNVLLCHDSLVGSHNFIAASSVIGGHSRIMNNNFIGFNSVVKDNIVIDREVLIGAKSLVLKSPENYCAYFGIPAVKIKEHKETGIQI